jgi:hypothetical protein
VALGAAIGDFVVCSSWGGNLFIGTLGLRRARAQGYAHSSLALAAGKTSHIAHLPCVHNRVVFHSRRLMPPTCHHPANGFGYADSLGDVLGHAGASESPWLQWRRASGLRRGGADGHPVWWV